MAFGDKMIGDFIKNNLANYLQNNWKELVPTFKKIFTENKDVIADNVLKNPQIDEYITLFNWTFQQSVAMELIFKYEFGEKYSELFDKIGRQEFKNEKELELYFVKKYEVTERKTDDGNDEGTN